MTARRLIRFAAPALFLGATAVFPALHQAFHDRDHDHEGGGIRFHGHAASHRHGAGPEHTHEAPTRHADPDDSDSRHGEGSLAHFSYALGEASPPPIGEISRPFESKPVTALRSDPEVQPGFFRPPSDRGPPVLPSHV